MQGATEDCLDAWMCSALRLAASITHGLFRESREHHAIAPTGRGSDGPRSRANGANRPTSRRQTARERSHSCQNGRSNRYERRASLANEAKFGSRHPRPILQGGDQTKPSVKMAEDGCGPAEDSSERSQFWQSCLQVDACKAVKRSQRRQDGILLGESTGQARERSHSPG
jgi:hypothetical protein